MSGLMQERPLLIQQLIDHAAQNHGDTEIVSRPVEGGIHRYTYKDARARAKKVAETLLALGIEPGDRIGGCPTTCSSSRRFGTRQRAKS